MKAQLIYNNKTVDIEVNDEQLKELLKEEKKPVKRWRAERYEHYRFIDPSCGNVTTIDLYITSDNYRYATGNYFKTEEEAEEYQRKLLARQRIIDRIAELNGDWKPDWSDEDETKHYITYKYEENRLCPDYIYMLQSRENEFYMKSEKIAKQIIKECEDDYKLIWGIK